MELTEALEEIECLKDRNLERIRFQNKIYQDWKKDKKIIESIRQGNKRWQLVEIEYILGEKK